MARMSTCVADNVTLSGDGQESVLGIFPDVQSDI